MPSDQIKVHVVKFGGRFLYMRYKDPETGKFVTRSTKTGNRKEALKAAGQWEAELREGRYKSPLKITWKEFRARYESEVLPGMAETTGAKVRSVFASVERILSPQRLSSLTGERISYFVKTLREEETEVTKEVTTRDADGRKQVEIHKTSKSITRAEATIKGHLATLKAALNWAKGQKMLHELPQINMPKRAKGSKMMKGRPITGEEFERMLAAVPAVVGEAAADSWIWFLRGLWWSGLRLEEALNLWWDTDDGISVDLSGRRPFFRIPCEHEKGHEDRLLPMAPEFAEMLLTIPREERDGRVFGLNYTRKDGVSKVVSDIGAKAGVKVDSKRTADPETPKVKYASAHDLRRSFGERWAMRPDIMPQVLMQLMRHESIETTMRYYVGKNAEMVADVLWKAVGNTSSNSLLVATSDSIGELSQQATHKEEVKTESYSSPIKTTDSGSVATSRRRTPRARSPGAPPAAEESSVGGTKVAVLSVSRKPEKSTGICLIVIEPNR